MVNFITLYRPIGSEELKLIQQSDYLGFPPRLPEQPIFYPVTNEEYAIQIARDWNAKFNDDKIGYVTKFVLPEAYLEQFERKVVGASMHEELWIPAEQLEEFNQQIVGKIEVLGKYTEADRLAKESE